MIVSQNDQANSFSIKSGEEVTRLVELPPLSDGYWINTGLSTLSTWAAIIILIQLTDDDND